MLLLLLLLALYYRYYQSTQKLGFDIAPTGDTIDPPQFLYSFNGGAANQRMQRPVGVLADGASVYVVDSARHTIGVFSPDGDYQRSFGTSETVVPLYIAKNPKDGNFYVSDRRARTIHIFSPSGKYLARLRSETAQRPAPEVRDPGHPVGACRDRLRCRRNDVRDRDPQRPPDARLQPPRRVPEVRWNTRDRYRCRARRRTCSSSPTGSRSTAARCT